MPLEFGPHAAGSIANASGFGPQFRIVNHLFDVAQSIGPLAEIPFGVKDIIETKGLSTEYGSPIYKGRLGTADAAIVEKLRSRGGVLLGKTHTTAFAYRTPAPTRNPRALDHTPGGSSSGS